MKKTTGLKHDDINKDLIVKEIQQKNFLDALLFSDNTKKIQPHSCYYKGYNQELNQRYACFLTRKLLEDGNAHYRYDFLILTWKLS